MATSLLIEENNQPLHKYWKGEVQVKRDELIESKVHIEAQIIRHRYTNYDELINSLKVQRLEALERSRVIAIIKYECTSQALQCVNWLIREQLEDARKETAKLSADVVRHKGLIGAIQKILWGNEKEISSLKAKIIEQGLELKSFNQLNERDKVIANYKKEITFFKKQYEQEKQRRIVLGKNNQRLSGKASHYKRIKSELDDFRKLYGSKKVIETPLFKELEKAKKEVVNRDRLINDYKVLKRTLTIQIKDLENKLKKDG